MGWFQFWVIMKMLLEHSGTNFLCGLGHSFVLCRILVVEFLGHRVGDLFSLSRNTGCETQARGILAGLGDCGLMAILRAHSAFGGAHMMVGSLRWSRAVGLLALRWRFRLKTSVSTCALRVLEQQVRSCFSSIYSVSTSVLEFSYRSSLVVSMQPCDREQLFAQFAAMKTGLDRAVSGAEP